MSMRLNASWTGAVQTHVLYKRCDPQATSSGQDVEHRPNDLLKQNKHGHPFGPFWTVDAKNAGQNLPGDSFHAVQSFESWTVWEDAQFQHV